MTDNRREKQRYWEKSQSILNTLHVVSYHLISGEVISTSTLRIGFAEYLNQYHSDEDFVLCHESVAAAVWAIDKLTKTELTVRNREILPVAKSRYAQVSEKYMNYRFR